MKTIITLSAALILTLNIFAQAPNKMSYQAVIRNSSNILVANQAVGMRISILQGSPTGVATYVETQMPTTNINGLASIEIGGGIIVTGDFATIAWANGPYFIKTETDPSGGTNYTISGTSQLLSVPYALFAANAGALNSGGNFTHYIGEIFGDGVIFHLWKDAQGGEHGLIVDKVELSLGQNWSNINVTSIGPSARSSYDGLSNSIAIVGQTGHINSAAALCLNSMNGGQNDWYLPSIDELSLLWHNRFNVNVSLSSIGATVLATNAEYWSSTEDGSNTAYCFTLTYGASAIQVKNNLEFVRAIRAF